MRSLTQLIAETLDSAPPPKDEADDLTAAPLSESIALDQKEERLARELARSGQRSLVVPCFAASTIGEPGSDAATLADEGIDISSELLADSPPSSARLDALDEPFASIAVEAIPVVGSLQPLHPARVNEPLLEGSVIARRYRVEGLLATSGMSVLYRALDLETERRVVIKLLHGRVAENKDAVARFQREARLMGRVTSEHVAKVLDVGFHQRCPFIVMELLEGSDLAQLLKQVGRLPLAPACDLVLQICEALAVAHAHGIVHRDLKPANVFVSVRPGGDLRVTIIDFGIAKAFVQEEQNDELVTNNELLIGSPRYMAPEQVECMKDIDSRADIWALGVIFQEILTGEAVFETDGGVMAKLVAIATKPPIPLRERWPDAPDAIVRVIDSALVKLPSARMPNVLLFAEQIAPFASASGAQTVRNIALAFAASSAICRPSGSFAAVSPVSSVPPKGIVAIPPPELPPAVPPQAPAKNVRPHLLLAAVAIVAAALLAGGAFMIAQRAPETASPVVSP